MDRQAENAQQLTDIDPKKLTKEQKHLFNIAKELHLLLNANESLGEKRDDARTFANGLKIIIDANTGPKGQVNTQRLLRDLQYFTIDQRLDLHGIPARVFHRFASNNTAHNLLGGNRLGARKWKKQYWDYGSYSDRNQAHHFMAYFILGYRPDIIPKINIDQIESYISDGTRFYKNSYNPEDLDLSDLALYFGHKVSNGSILWKDLPDFLYYMIRD